MMHPRSPAGFIFVTGYLEPMTPPSVDGLLTFFYYKDFKKAGDFYENIMGFKMVQDQKWAKIFQVAEKTFMGCEPF